MTEFVADEVWDRIGDHLAAATTKRAAIAYVGRSAPEILPLGDGDRLIVDGSDAALRAGSTHPDALAAWLRLGVKIRSLVGLHAKVLLLDSNLVIVGSANASLHSANNLHEAVLITDDDTCVQDVSEQLDLWWQSSEPVDHQWIHRARTIFREGDRPLPVKRGLRRRPALDAPLWVCECSPSGAAPTEAVEEAIASAQGRHDGMAVDSFELHRRDRGKVDEDHAVILVPSDGRRPVPHGNAKAWAPATVARVVAERGRPPVAILVHDEDQPRVSFARIRSAIDAANGTLTWDEPLSAGAVTAAVRGLWPSERD
jgi:hypothetical protein